MIMKVSKIDWLYIAIVYWVGATVLYLLNENLGVIVL